MTKIAHPYEPDPRPGWSDSCAHIGDDGRCGWTRAEHATTTDPTILKVIPRRNGIAGEYRVSAVVQYDGEAPETVMFKSSVYGPPIVMITDGNPGGTFVSQRVIDRIGTKLDEAWVRAFFGPREGE